MSSVKLRSYAKINLYLKVLNKRADGFHNIETVFERINLHDDLIFSTNSSGKITISCNHPHVPIGSKNLIYKIAKMLKEDYNIKGGVHVDVFKRIPVAAGLAGGSSNAATTLLGLNQLWKLNLKKSVLGDYAQKIGSDVNFFLEDTSWGLGTERGNVIKKLNLKAQLWHILVVPKVKVYSAKVYGALNLQLTKNCDNATMLIHYLRKNDLDSVSHYLLNDLQPAIIRFCPRLLKLKEKLKSLNTQGVMISGSGPSVFGIVKNREEAEKLKSLLAKRYSQVFVVKTL